MRVTPISAEKANEGSGFEPWPKGEYDFTVREASESTSNAGNEQIALTLDVFNADGKRRTVFDYLVNTPGGAYKVRHFAEATGMIKDYERGDMDVIQIEGKSGRLILRIQPAQGNYEAKNAVADYVKSVAPEPRAKPTSQPARAAVRSQPAGRPAPSNVDDDDIPF